jgi:hypothetical protein
VSVIGELLAAGCAYELRDGSGCVAQRQLAPAHEIVVFDHAVVEYVRAPRPSDAHTTDVDWQKVMRVWPRTECVNRVLAAFS